MTLQTFTGKEYLKIDIASNFGCGRDDWDDRISWFDRNETKLHSLVPQAEEPALFYAGILAWEAAKEGKPSGYPISLDATCSGIQILSALSCDRKAAEITNLVDTGSRKDAYVSIYQDMVNTMGEGQKIDRKKTKLAIMTAFYNSTAVPKSIFGEGEMLNVFFDTVQDNAPGAWAINEAMLQFWDPTKLVNEWVLPDNFHVKVKVMGKSNETVHFLNEPFEVTYDDNKPIKGGRSLGANQNHSIDGMVVREMQNRCTYNPAVIKELKNLVHVGGGGHSLRRPEDKLVQTLWDHYQNSGFLSSRILNYLNIDNCGLVNHIVLGRLLDSLPAKPFDIITVHDCFRCLPNYGNDLRQQYNNILAEIAESDLLSYIVSQIVGRPIRAGKLDPSIAQEIRFNNYALS